MKHILPTELFLTRKCHTNTTIINHNGCAVFKKIFAKWFIIFLKIISNTAQHVYHMCTCFVKYKTIHFKIKWKQAQNICDRPLISKTAGYTMDAWCIRWFLSQWALIACHGLWLESICHTAVLSHSLTLVIFFRIGAGW